MRRLLRDFGPIGLCVALALASRASADTPPVIDCAWYSPTAGDNFAKVGFFVAGYGNRGTSLKQVTLYLSFPSTGAYTLSLTANQSTFDGPVVGTATTSLTVGSAMTFQAVTFDFGTISISQSNPTVTFHGAVVSMPSGATGNVLMETATDPSCPVFETTDATAPLSTWRRNGIAVTMTGDVPSTIFHQVTIPASASIHGANGTFFHTDVWIYNSVGTANVTATYRCFAGQSCGSGTATFALGPGQAKTFSDIVGTLFGAPETAGAVNFGYFGVGSNNQLEVVSRTYSPSLPSPTNGASLNGLLFIGSTGSKHFVGLGNNGGDRSAGFRTNVGVYNPHGFPATVTFALQATDGTPIGQAVTQTWAGQESRQINDIFAAAGAGGVVTNDAVLHVTSTLSVFPYATVIDNVTGDSVIEE